MRTIIDYFKYSQGNIYILAIFTGISVLCLILFALTFLIRKKPKTVKPGNGNAVSYCPDCGKPARSGSAFCKYCGSKLI